MKPKPTLPSRANKKDIDVLELLELVPFSPENVLDAVCGNTVLYVTAIQYRLRCLERAADAKRTWEQACSALDLQLRKEARANDDKITEGHIKAQILLNKEVRLLAEAHQQAEVYDEYSKLIVRVFEMRRDMLQTVASLVNREYPISKMAEQAADRMKQERNKLRQRFPEE